MPKTRTKKSPEVPSKSPARSGLEDLVLITGDPYQEIPFNPEELLAKETVEGKVSPISFSQAARKWAYAVRSRQRWAMSDEAAKRQADEAAQMLATFRPFDARKVAEIAHAGIVEVSIPWRENSRAFDAQVFPWEYLLAGATRSQRGGAALTVVRHLRVPTPTRETPRAPRVLFVASEPGPLQGLFDFTTERDLLRTHLQVPATRWKALKSPTLIELGTCVADFKPDLVHVAGFDTPQALSLLTQNNLMHEAGRLIERSERGRKTGEEISEGYVLALRLDRVESQGQLGARDRLQPVDPATLGRALNAGGPLALVSFNLWNSSSQIAPQAVAAGAGAAIGFQDVFDDDLAEVFFACVYSELRRGWNLCGAFRSAWEIVRKRSGVAQGTGVVLWSASPLLSKRKAPASTGKSPDRTIDVQKVALRDVEDWVRVDVTPLSDLNYSLLHNRRPLFSRFSLIRQSPDTVRDVRVRVALSVGEESASFERTLTLDTPIVDLKREIHIPLISSLTRSVHESVRTSLLVDITWGPHTILRDTYSVRIVPVDQWRDTRLDRVWLPSFVFPRDPAVAQIVDKAQRYLKVLRDDPATGFDGYQGVNAKKEESLEDTDLQVRAIWSAILHDLPLAYVNPPPGYSREMDSQRLRTPSMICRDRSGTCIDLALFFAACLELVDIYPVIFLLEGHAFVGYWRAFEFHDDFAQARPSSEEAVSDSNDTPVPGVQREPWFVGKAAYREIVRHVESRHLVPLETVRLTEHCGFAEALDAGRDNLRVQADFEALVDLSLAREAQVTPLPIWGEQQ